MSSGRLKRRKGPAMYFTTFATVGAQPFSSRMSSAFGKRDWTSRISCARFARTMIVTMPLALEATSTGPTADLPVP